MAEIRREIKLYIEAELRDYHKTLKQIDEDRDDLLNESSAGDNSGIRGSSISNPTHNRAARLITSKSLRRMEQTCRAIQTVIEALPEEKYKLVELKYWTSPQPLTDIGIAQQLNIDRATFYRWTDGILIAIGIEVGLINIGVRRK